MLIVLIGGCDDAPVRRRGTGILRLADEEAVFELALFARNSPCRMPGQRVVERDRPHLAFAITLLMKSFVSRQMPVAVSRSVLVSCVSYHTLNSSVRGCLMSGYAIHDARDDDKEVPSCRWRDGSIES